MNCNKKFKILVTEAVGELGLEILRGAPDVELIEKVGISKDEIKRELADVNGILTRSGTTMDQEMIDCAPAMKVIARAGVGVDNINIPAASRKGIIVINAPITPPRSIYLLSTCQSAATLSRPVKSQARTQTAKADSCTQPVDTQRLVCFVTSVLKTP